MMGAVLAALSNSGYSPPLLRLRWYPGPESLTPLILGLLCRWLAEDATTAVFPDPKRSTSAVVWCSPGVTRVVAPAQSRPLCCGCGRDVLGFADGSCLSCRLDGRR
jgi:hypothetical protein